MEDIPAHAFALEDRSTWASMIQNKRAHSETIHAASQRIVPTSEEGIASTELLEDVRSSISNRTYDIPTLAVLMQIQAKFLPEECFTAFYWVAKLFVSLLDQDAVALLCREVADISYRITNMSCILGKPKAVVSFMRELVRLTSFSEYCLTSIQVDYLQVCISAQMYGAAQELLRGRSFLQLDLNKTTLTPSEVLRFFYYKGLCHLASKDWVSAMEAFGMVCSLPMAQLSLMAVQSLKKSKLLSLLLHHKPFQLPKHTCSVVSNYNQEQLPGVYEELDRCFCVLDAPGLQTALVVDSEGLAADQNLGLAKQLVGAMRVAQLHKLKRAYLSASMDEVAEALALQPSQLLNVLLEANLQKLVHARVDLAEGMVLFGNSSDAPAQLFSDMELHNVFQEVAQLNELLRAKHSQLLSLPAYIAKNTASKGQFMGVRGFASHRQFSPSSMGMSMDTSP